MSCTSEQATGQMYDEVDSATYNNIVVPLVFEEPARALTRNALVIAIGFTPLLLAPLVPYITVGAFMAAIMTLSGISTLVLLPALMSWAGPWLFADRRFQNA